MNCADTPELDWPFADIGFRSQTPLYAWINSDVC